MSSWSKIQAVESFVFPTEATRIAPAEQVVAAQLPGYEGAVMPPGKIQAVLDPAQQAGGHGAAEFARTLGYELEHWQELGEQIKDRLPTTQAVLLNPGAGVGAEWETAVLVTGAGQSVCYVAVKWIVPIAKEPTTFITAAVERSERNEELRTFGLRPRGDPLLFRRAGLVS